MIVPYSWFLALEQSGLLEQPLFRDPANLEAYNLVPNPDPTYNPAGLPIGITSETLPEKDLQTFGCGAPPCSKGSKLHKRWLSFTCAACHTSVLRYAGVNVGIDGGRGQWNISRFTTDLINALLLTRWVPGRLGRFTSRVLGLEQLPDTLEERENLAAGLKEFLDSRQVNAGIQALILNLQPTEEGFGRIDALGRTGNSVFGQLDPRNLKITNAPVVIPSLWMTHDYNYVQSISAIRQPLARNLTQSWGVNAAINLLGPNRENRFRSTAPLQHLHWMETLLSILTPPAWPESTLGPVDKKAAEFGRYLFEEKVFENALTPREEQWCDQPRTCPSPRQTSKGLCARCHRPALEEMEALDQRFWQLPVYKLQVIGTDPKDAENFQSREIWTGNIAEEFGGKKKVGIDEAIAVVTSGILQREFDLQKIPPEKQSNYTGFRRNQFRAPLGYPARPLQGAWATPPFLHNGSVLSIYELLSPVEERSLSFWTGSREFDPRRLGFRPNHTPNAVLFQTTRSFIGTAAFAVREALAGRFTAQVEVAGNSNRGHEFRNAPRGTPGVIGPALNPDERRAIIEYLKVLPPLPATGGADTLNQRRRHLREMRQDYQKSH